MARRQKTKNRSGCLNVLLCLFAFLVLIIIVTPAENEEASVTQVSKAVIEDSMGASNDLGEENDSTAAIVCAIVISILTISGIIWAVYYAIKKQRIEKEVSSLTNKVEVKIQGLQSADSVSGFVSYWDSLQQITDTINSYEGTKRFKGISFNNAKYQLKRVEPNYQMFFRDAIDRQMQTIKHQMKTTYKNSKEHKERMYWEFMRDLDRVCNRFSEETKEFADEAGDSLYRATKMSFKPHSHYLDIEESINCDESSTRTIEEQLRAVDCMSGNDFENYCADLLKKNGFIRVSVTPGSGDQGVDILAEKDSIRYAIQCKCYSQDLGNTPVQEVHTGKQIYNCHVGAVLTNRNFTSGAREAAEKTNVLLWDREKLIEFMGINESNNRNI